MLPAPQVVRVGPNGTIIAGGDGGGFAPGAQFSSSSPAAPIGTQMPFDMARDISYAFFLMVAAIAIGVPLVRAFARWLDRRSVVPAGIPADLGGRLDRIEQAVEAVAIEVERISEGQRFTSKLLSDLRPSSPIAAQLAAPAVPAVPAAQQVPR
jgi:hypothetical protein